MWLVYKSYVMKKFVFFFFIFWLSLAGCSALSEPDSIEAIGADDQKEILISRIDTTDVVTIEDLLIVDEKMEMAESRAAARVISDITPIKDETGKMLMYVINYKDNRGFRIISAQKEYEPLLAYSDEGNFNMESLNDIGVSIWLKDIKQSISDVDQLPDSIKLRNRLEWSCLIGKTERRKVARTRSLEFTDYKKQINDELIELNRQGYMIYPLSDFIPKTNYSPTFADGILPPEDIVRQISNISNEEVIVDSYVVMKYYNRTSNASRRKLMNTEWGQSAPFNSAIPYYPNNKDRFLGCTAVASGQILAYKRYLSGYDYNTMLASTPNYNEISKFLYYIGTRIGIDYPNNESGASIDDVRKALNGFGLTCSYDKNFDTGQIIKSIDADIPVYVRGKSDKKYGHAWVVDGYDYKSSEGDCKVLLLNAYKEDIIGESIFWCYGTKTEVFSESKLYHCNWGWNGYQDGFYVNGSFNTANGNYNSAIQMLSNIRKR